MGLGIIARSLLASVFITDGIDEITEPGGRPKAVKSALDKVPMDLGENAPELLVKAHGIVMVGAGTTLALGILPKLSAAALIAAIIPTTIIGHPFWTTDDPKARRINKSQVLKNAAIVGGLIQVIAQRKKTKAAAA